MKILVVFYSTYSETYFRKTFKDHLLSIKKYSKEDVFYHNSYLGSNFYLKKKSFDLIIFHYSFMAQKWNCNGGLLKQVWLKNLKGKKVIMCQDEYINSKEVNEFIDSYNIKTVFSCSNNEKDKQIIYPNYDKRGFKIITVLPGYIEQSNINSQKLLKPHKNRGIDIFYRARSNSYFLGEFSLRKTSIANKFQAESPNNLKLNISINENDTITGKKWFEYLENSRVALGVEGGASCFDYNGSIKSKVEKYITQYPNSSFYSVHKNILKSNDDVLNYRSLSPRSFEACLTKTCQVLIEGEYSGVLKPNKHYIPLKEDYSNFHEVLEKINNLDYCEQIAEKAFIEIVNNNKYSYEYFVNIVLDNENNNKSCRKEKKRLVTMINNFFQLNILPIVANVIRLIYRK